MSDRPSRHGINDQRALGPGQNGMRIGPPKLLGLIDPYGSVPAVCSGCGAELHGAALDSPVGWICSSECPAKADLAQKLWAEANLRTDGTALLVPFSETGLDPPR